MVFGGEGGLVGKLIWELWEVDGRGRRFSISMATRQAHTTAYNLIVWRFFGQCSTYRGSKLAWKRWGKRKNLFVGGC